MKNSKYDDFKIIVNKKKCDDTSVFHRLVLDFLKIW